MTEIYQKKGGEIRGYKILNDVIEAEIKHNGNHQIFQIRLEEIFFNEMVQKRKPQPLVIGLFFSLMVNFILLVFLFADRLTGFVGNETIISSMAFAVLGGFSFLIMNISKNNTEKILQGMHNIFFFYNKKDQLEVDKFINTLKTTQRKYIRNKYMKIDDYSPKETLEQTISWLYERNFISNNEFEGLLSELRNRKIIDGI
ncbi:hypothetical protein [Marinigracilibium pacificum]|uniref:Uncharacterized protein n=1 Tax=Marinigracilibium pacificum TaxID=2729599 RepID=A0A848IU21_9BACT|nr:hypothetical protein [Marinigracilibium pacificum]NMM47837.1 hypothetical protein [Marinigracilibium pacificum]